MQVRARDGVAGFAGLASCGSVWACPVCNAKIQATRRVEVGAALNVVLGTAGGAAFGAYTLRHHAGSDLDRLWRSLSKCWEAVTRDKSVRRLREAFGLVGIIRAAECTHGGNGWHPHLHPVLLFSRRLSDVEVEALHRAQFRAWSAAAARLGLEAPTEQAQHLHALSGAGADATLADYFTKASYAPSVESVAWEATSTQTKSRTRAAGSRTPWDLLTAVHRDGDADALDLWHTWEKASKGKRALTWSRGLRARLGVGAEISDEDVAAEEVGTAADAGFVIVDWSPVRAAPRLGAQLLGALEGGRNWKAGRDFCAAHGIEIREA